MENRRRLAPLNTLLRTGLELSRETGLDVGLRRRWQRIVMVIDWEWVFQKGRGLQAGQARAGM